MNSVPEIPDQEPLADWQPVARPEILRQRAELLAAIRIFMDSREVLEVETPLLSCAAVSDPALQSYAVQHGDTTRYLQTSPEFAMKRLLAAGSGPIYQITRVFRDDERGRWHHPEFTLLEWYRPAFSVNDMLDEIDDLLNHLQFPAAKRCTYAALFEEALDIDPHTANRRRLQQRAEAHGLGSRDLSHAQLLDFLFSETVMPLLKQYRCSIVQDFPVQQAALARIRPGRPPVAERFELFIDGIEIGNGFHELSDAAEQRHRFLADQTERQRRCLPRRPLDERFLAAIEAGLPDCCGMAVGLDRLLMLKAGVTHIDEVLAFPCERA